MTRGADALLAGSATTPPSLDRPWSSSARSQSISRVARNALTVPACTVRRGPAGPLRPPAS